MPGSMSSSCGEKSSILLQSGVMKTSSFVSDSGVTLCKSCMTTAQEGREGLR